MNWAIAESIASIIASVGVIIAVSQLSLHKKQLNLDTISRCIDKFRSFGDLYIAPQATVQQYVDLVNEEIFYIQNGYIIKKIAKE